MRVASITLAAIFMAFADPASATDDDRIMLPNQEPNACKMMWTIITTAAIKHSFESLQDPEAKAIVEQDGLDIEVPAKLPVKPFAWTCDVMPGNIDVICTVRDVEDPAPNMMKRLEKKMMRLVQKCTSTESVGWRDNISVDARRGYAFPFNEDIIGFVRSAEYKTQNGGLSGRHGLFLSFSIGKLKK